MNVVAVVVTYNRKDLLLECLNSIMQQSYPVKNIIVIDNASTDGTDQMLDANHFIDNDSIIYKKMDKNLGGAGGFYEGIKIARDLECDWIWIMDDDTIPSKDCLLELHNAQKKIAKKESLFGNDCIRKTAFLASAVYGPEGEYMNIPDISNKPSPNGYPYWYAFLTEGIVAINCATFVSILLRKEAVIKCGLPCKDYFIWGDDSEYTMRLFKYYGEGFFVGKSVAIHKRKGAHALSIEAEDNVDRIKMFHYLYRNSAINERYYNNRKHPFLEILRGIWHGMKLIVKDHGFEKARAVVKGKVEAATEYKKFKKYIDNQINGDV